jgi:predicted pyridoxine 5'-phosphate oxidase superfamily flavin-nucleotide-binding protein
MFSAQLNEIDKIAAKFTAERKNLDIETNELLDVTSFTEHSGKGSIDRWKYCKLGSALFAADNNKILLDKERNRKLDSRIFLSINGSIKGFLLSISTVKEEITSSLKDNYKLSCYPVIMKARENLERFFN